MAQTTTQRALVFLLRETIGDILLFPIWWYSTGLVMISKRLGKDWLEVEEWLSLRILLKNMFRPMFADYSKTGRIISFFVRLAMVSFKGVILAVWTVVELALFMLWVTVPVLSLGLLVRQLIPSING